MPRNNPGIFHFSRKKAPPSSSVAAKQQPQQEEVNEVVDHFSPTVTSDKAALLLQRYKSLKRKWAIHSQSANNKDRQMMRKFFDYFNEQTLQLVDDAAMNATNKQKDAAAAAAAANTNKAATASSTTIRNNRSTTASQQNELQQRARQVWIAVHQDFLALKNAMDAAQVDLATRLAEAPKTKRPRIESLDVDPEWGCNEAFQWSDSTEATNNQVTDTTTASAQDRPVRLLRMAQETAAIREAAKLLRKRARELAQQRASTNRN